jgi:hypothetical protein
MQQKFKEIGVITGFGVIAVCFVLSCALDIAHHRLKPAYLFSRILFQDKHQEFCSFPRTSLEKCGTFGSTARKVFNKNGVQSLDWRFCYTPQTEV